MLLLTARLQEGGKRPERFFFTSDSFDTVEKRVFGYDRAEQDKKTKETLDRQDKSAQEEKNRTSASDAKTKALEDRDLASPEVYRLIGLDRDLAVTIQRNGQRTSCVLAKEGDRGDEQKWSVEYCDRANKIAIKSVANGEYLGTTFDDATKTHVVGTTPEKYWWWIQDFLEPRAYRACRLQSFPLGADYLNTYSKGDSITMWEWKVRSRVHHNDDLLLTGGCR